MKTYFIVAGDPSADKYSANLMQEIRNFEPSAKFIGIGGPEMIARGLEPLAKMNDVAVVGFWEVAKRYAFFKNLLNKCNEVLSSGKIDAFIPVDYPGFNIRLAKSAKKLGIPVYYYIAPQLWAWGKNRAKSLANLTDKLFVVFPFEVDYFASYGINATFVGHPLLDESIFSSKIKTLSERNNQIAFFPGSRNQEVKKHLSLLTKILEQNKIQNYNFDFVVAKSSNIPEHVFAEIARNPNVSISENNIEIMLNSSAGIIKTGTSNLEAALCGMPFGMFYKTSTLTFKIAEHLVNLPYISIINILSNKFVIPEFIQNDAKPDKILKFIQQIISNPTEYTKIQNEFEYIRKILGGGGAALCVAKHITDN